MKRWIFFPFLIIGMTTLAACGGNTSEENSADPSGSNSDTDTNDAQEVQVDLKDADDESVGSATLEEVPDGVKVAIEGENLPKGTHAFHIHEKGQCEAPDFKSAGGHYNPDDTNHGYDDPDGPHIGDMPNILVGEDGTVNQAFLVKNATLDEGEDYSLIDDEGTSLVIHEGADDGKSQPSGDAGDRLACGPIGK